MAHLVEDGPCTAWDSGTKLAEATAASRPRLLVVVAVMPPAWRWAWLGLEQHRTSSSMRRTASPALAAVAAAFGT